MFVAVALAVACGSAESPPSVAPPPAPPSPPPSPAPPDGGPDTATTYGDLTDRARWTSFDLRSVSPLADTFAGGAFDGRYVYYVPSGTSGRVLRYDTQSNAFTTASSWTEFDATSVDANARGFYGAVFDGRYVTYVPLAQKVALRYDTQAPFTSPAAYEKLDLTTIDVTAGGGYAGATFDGRYLYFAPLTAGAVGFGGLVLRYDTAAPFAGAASWKKFDVRSLNVSAQGFAGGIFDGRYVYLAPFVKDGSTRNGHIARYDTTAGAFDVASSWSVFDTGTIDPEAQGFEGGAFDGKYVTFVPALGAAAVRVDPAGAFTSPTSWSAFKTTELVPSVRGFAHGAFDGKFVYFGSRTSGRVARVDPTTSFTTAGAWSTFDLATLTPPGGATAGVTFDGRYLYLVPTNDAKVTARFDAKVPPALPPIPQYRGSFF